MHSYFSLFLDESNYTENLKPSDNVSDIFECLSVIFNLQSVLYVYGYGCLSPEFSH